MKQTLVTGDRTDFFSRRAFELIIVSQCEIKRYCADAVFSRCRCTYDGSVRRNAAAVRQTVRRYVIADVYTAARPTVRPTDVT
jgi:HJR/Mrr/RecB family endonuclease